MDKIEEQQVEQERRTFLERLSDVVPCLGILMCLCASLFLVSAVLVVKLVKSVDGIQVAFFKSMVQVVMYFVIIKLRGINFRPIQGETRAVVVRAFTSSLSMALAYYVLKLIPLGDSVAIRSSVPIWTLILGYLFLGEPIGLILVIAIMISFSGLILVAKPDDCVYLYHLVLNYLGCESADDLAISTNYYLKIHDYEHKALQDPDHRTLGCFLALFSSIPLAVSLIALRRCRKTPAEVIIFWLSLAAVTICSVGLTMLGNWRMPSDLTEWFLILLSGVCASLGHFFLTNASKVEYSGVIALMRNFDPVIAFLYSAFLLEELVRTTSIIGSCLVGVGVVAVITKKMFLSDTKNLQTTTK